MPELSIIVPVYKVEKYLPRCIDSILAQTFRDFELILIDDGSPDNCGRICDEYAARDSRIKVIHQKNAGVSAARNAGLDIACGTYLGFVDSDDWIEPEMYETMIATAKEKNVDVVVCGVNFYGEDEILIRRDLERTSYLEGESLLFELYGMPNSLGGGGCNKLFRRDPIRTCRFKKGVAMAEDWLFLFSCFMHCNACTKIPNPFYNICERPGSATRTDRIETIYEPLVTVKFESIALAKAVSEQLEAKALDKYLDDCLRFVPVMCRTARMTSQKYIVELLHIKWIMFQLIVNAYYRKLLPKAKLNGYLVGMIRVS